MGKKIEKLESAELNYKGDIYRRVFNLNVMEQIQEEYESVSAWGELTQTAEEPNAKAVKFGITCMLNEGIEIYNEEHEDDEDFKPRKLLTDRQVGRIISEVGLANTTMALKQTVVASTKSDEKN
jgi:hypothetical protein